MEEVKNKVETVFEVSFEAGHKVEEYSQYLEARARS
jgi:hypothetical protein